MKSTESKIKRIIVYIIVILTPFLLLLMLSLRLGYNVFDSVPIHSDEIGYWRQIYSFSEYLWNTGYIGRNETHSKLGAFGPHGFFAWPEARAGGID